MSQRFPTDRTTAFVNELNAKINTITKFRLDTYWTRDYLDRFEHQIREEDARIQLFAAKAVSSCHHPARFMYGPIADKDPICLLCEYQNHKEPLHVSWLVVAAIEVGWLCGRAGHKMKQVWEILAAVVKE